MMNLLTVGIGVHQHCCTDSIWLQGLTSGCIFSGAKTIWGQFRAQVRPLLWTPQHLQHPELISLSRCLSTTSGWTHKCQDFSALLRNQYFFLKCSSLVNSTRVENCAQQVINVHWRPKLPRVELELLELLPQKLLPRQSH